MYIFSDASNSLLGILPTEVRAYVHRKTCSRMFITIVNHSCTLKNTQILANYRMNE